MSIFKKLTFISCCDEPQTVLEFQKSLPHFYINESTYYYNSKCYTAYVNIVSFVDIDGLPISPPISGTVPQLNYELNNSYFLEGGDCDAPICLDCSFIDPDDSHPENCFYIENCFNSDINFIAVISNDEFISEGNAYSFLDLSNIQNLPIDFNNCWTITPIDLCDITATVIEITTAYASCDNCAVLEVPPCFLLIDCITGDELIYSGDVLSEYVNRVIQINIEGVIKCFSVEEAPCTEESLELVFEHVVLHCFDLDQCVDCLPNPEPIKTPTLRYVQPGYDTALCDSDKVEKIKCTFAELMYQQAMSRRFNIKFCCPKDLGLWQLRNEKIILDLTKFINPTPDPCNPICKTYAYEFVAGMSGSISYLNCSSVDVTVDVLLSVGVQRFEFCALDYPGVTISITNTLGVVVNTFTIQPVEVICIL